MGIIIVYVMTPTVASGQLQTDRQVAVQSSVSCFILEFGCIVLTSVIFFPPSS